MSMHIFVHSLAWPRACLPCPCAHHATPRHATPCHATPRHATPHHDFHAMPHLAASRRAQHDMTCTPVCMHVSRHAHAAWWCRWGRDTRRAAVFRWAAFILPPEVSPIQSTFARSQPCSLATTHARRFAVQVLHALASTVSAICPHIADGPYVCVHITHNTPRFFTCSGDYVLLTAVIFLQT